MPAALVDHGLEVAEHGEGGFGAGLVRLFFTGPGNAGEQDIGRIGERLGILDRPVHQGQEDPGGQFVRELGDELGSAAVRENCR
jgi:hypothetical protein